MLKRHALQPKYQTCRERFLSEMNQVVLRQTLLGP